jgi:ankyrin repeat protein
MRARTIALVFAALVFAAIGVSAPAVAQFSDSYDLIKAVRDNDLVKARELLEKPGSTTVNAREKSGDAPIHIVTRQRQIDWLGFLLHYKADRNARDGDGNTPLIIAAAGRWTEGVQLLIAIRADVDRRNNAGETALIKTAAAGDTVDTRILLDAGANPDLTDNAAGHSARDYATQRGGPIARMLADAPKAAKAPVQGPTR